MKRLMAIPVSLNIFEELMTEGNEIKVVCTRGLPDGANLVNTFYDGYMHSVVLVYEHESFAPIGEGEIIPKRVAEFQHLD